MHIALPLNALRSKHIKLVSLTLALFSTLSFRLLNPGNRDALNSLLNASGRDLIGIVVHILDGTAERTAHGGSLGDDVLGAHDDHAVADPVEGDVAEDVDEADERDDVRDAGAGRSVGDGALDRREDGTARDAHDEDAGTAAGVAAEVGGAKGEEGGVHGRLEEEDDDEDGDGGRAGAGADVGVQRDGAAAVDDHDKVGREDGGQAGGDEAADGEGDEGVRQHVGGLRRGVGGVLSGIVDEEGGNGDLRADVAELGDEGEDHVVLLVQRTGTNLAAELILSEVVDGVLARELLLGDLRELGNSEENADGDTGTSNGKVDELHVGEAVRVGPAEEELGGDEGADEGSDTVPRLAELETGRGGGGVTDDDGVRVGSRLKGGETAGDDESASAEAAEGGLLVARLGEVCRRPEHDGTKRVEGKAHEDGQPVALALHDLSGDGREQEVTTTEVDDLETGRLELGDTKDRLEVFVEDIEETVRETP